MVEIPIVPPVIVPASPIDKAIDGVVDGRNAICRIFDSSAEVTTIDAKTFSDKRVEFELTNLATVTKHVCGGFHTILCNSI